MSQGRIYAINFVQTDRSSFSRFGPGRAINALLLLQAVSSCFCIPIIVKSAQEGTEIRVGPGEEEFVPGSAAAVLVIDHKDRVGHMTYDGLRSKGIWEIPRAEDVGQKADFARRPCGMRSRDGADDGGCGEIADETAAPLHEIPVTRASVLPADLSTMLSSKSDAKETEEAEKFAGAVTTTKLIATAKGVESEIVKVEAESKNAEGKDVCSKTYPPQAIVSYTEVRSIQWSPTCLALHP